jgi:hypothetical protein
MKRRMEEIAMTALTVLAANVWHTLRAEFAGTK